MVVPQVDVTLLLDRAARGDRQAQEELFRRVEGELRKRAHACLRRGPAAPSVQTTLLVDDAFLKLVGRSGTNWESRTHFYCCAAKVMRQFLVDEARRRLADKRGGGQTPVSLGAVPEPAQHHSPDPATTVAVHEALEKLAGPHPELLEVVELHHFGGWDLHQIADEILHVPYPTVRGRWQRAKALLYRALHPGEDEPHS